MSVSDFATVASDSWSVLGKVTHKSNPLQTEVVPLTKFNLFCLFLSGFEAAKLGFKFSRGAVRLSNHI